MQKLLIPLLLTSLYSIASLAQPPGVEAGAGAPGGAAGFPGGPGAQGGPGGAGGPGGFPGGGPPGMVQLTEEQLAMPGATWESLRSLPELTGSNWVAVDAPDNEVEYLKNLALPPVREEYREEMELALADILNGNSVPASESCELEGTAHLSWYPYETQFLYGPANVMIKQHDFIRRVRALGLERAPRNNEGLDSSRAVFGQAQGEWQGQTLRIESEEIRSDRPVFYGLVGDPDLRVVEEYELTGPDRMVKRVTIESPMFLTAPWTIETAYQRQAETGWATRFCLPEGSLDDAPLVTIAEEDRNPAPENAVFTPDMTWAQIDQLPKLWGIGWEGDRVWDSQVAAYDNITLWPPLKPEYMAQARDYEQRLIDGRAEYLYAGCWPSGMPRHVWYTYPPIFFFKPGNSILIDVSGETREIYMDGRGHPATLDSSDPAIAYLGHSIGWWEDETLVIDTVGFAPVNHLYMTVENSGNMHVRERYRLIEPGRFEVNITISDPDRLEEPWEFSREYAGSSTSMGLQQAGAGGSGIATWPCRPGSGDSREVVDQEGNSFINLSPPPRGSGLGG